MTPADVEQVRRLLHVYAERLDAGDLDGVAALFERATFGSAARPTRLAGGQEVRRVLDAVMLYDGSPCTRHVITNEIVEADGADRATSRCYFTMLQARPDLPLQPILAGRYHDRFEQANGTWHFTDRLIRPDLVGDLSRHMRRS